MNQDFLVRLMRTYDINGFTPQPANPHLRNIAKIIDARQSDRECVETLTQYLRLNGIPAGTEGLDFSPPAC